MKMRCIARVQWKGDVVHVGDIVVMNNAEAKSPFVRSSFVPVAPEGRSTPPADNAEDGKKIVAGLTREQVILKLESMKVNIPAGASDKELAQIFKAMADSAAHRGADR